MPNPAVVDESARIDAHHHVWDLAVRDQPWTAGLPPLRRSFAMAGLRPALLRHRIGATIVVQTVTVAEETPELLALAAAEPEIAGVVGWVDLTAPDVPRRLAALRQLPGGGTLVGIRHQVQSEPDSRWLCRADVRSGLAAVGAAGLVYDLLVIADQLPAVIETVQALPDVRFVLDHAGNPPAQQPQPLSGPVATAVKSGIPVVTVDSGVTPTTSNSFIATSNIKAAAAVCEYGAKLAGGKGTYGIIDFNEISSTGRARPQGCKQGMATYPGFKFVSMQISNNVIATGKAETEAMLTANPNINLMFGANDRAALGVAEGVEALHKTKQVTVVGFDADLGEVPLIANGVIKGSLLQSPYTMGYQAVQELVAIKSGKSVPERVDTKTFIITPQNVNTATAKQFLAQYGAAKGVAP